MINSLNSIFPFFFSQILIPDAADAIKCYRCTVGPSHRHENQTQRLCMNFEESEDFEVDCEFSTMCMKKVYRYQLQDGTVVETVSRNCAQQKHTEQVSWEIS